MPYVGGEIASLFHVQPAELTLVRLAQRGGDRMVEWTVANTPIDSGNLRTSWYQRTLSRARRGPLAGWESGVATDVDYAPHVEHGTGLWGPEGRKYLIEPSVPGGWLRWLDPSSGEEVFAKRVWHPGSPGQHMVAIAAHMTEAEFDSVVDDVMAEWVHLTEALAD